MPLITKKSYQYFNIAFILVIASLYPLLTHGVRDNSELVFYGAGLITMIVMSMLLIFVEYKLGIINKLSAIIYSLVGVILPPLIFLSKYSYIVILLVFLPLLIYNLYKQKRANYKFRVDNYYLINLIYLVNMILGVLVLLTKESYYLIGLIFILLTLTLDVIILIELYNKKSPTINRRVYLSLLVFSLTFFLAFAGEVSISSVFNQMIISINLIYPILSIIFLSLSSRLNRSNLVNLVNISSIE